MADHVDLALLALHRRCAMLESCCSPAAAQPATGDDSAAGEKPAATARTVWQRTEDLLAAAAASDVANQLKEFRAKRQRVAGLLHRFGLEQSPAAAAATAADLRSVTEVAPPLVDALEAAMGRVRMTEDAMAAPAVLNWATGAILVGAGEGSSDPPSVVKFADKDITAAVAECARALQLLERLTALVDKQRRVAAHASDALRRLSMDVAAVEARLK